MIETLLRLLATAVAILPFVILCLFNHKVRINKANRVKQFIMPVITLIYGIAAILLLEFVNGGLHWVYNWLAEYITILQDFSWDFIAIYVLNAVFVLGFMVIKAIMIPIMSAISFSPDSLVGRIVGIFYEYDERNGKWFVKREYSKFRGFYRGIYYAFFAISVVIFILSQNFSQSNFFRGVFYPFFGILIIYEVVSFLSGMTQLEFVEDVLGEDEESYSVANYGILRGILRDLYEDRVLFENTIDTDDGIPDTYEVLEEMLSSDDRNVRIVGNYFQTLRESGEDIDINYVNNCLKLLRGESTLFCNPFYNDLTHYVVLPSVQQLISYNKCLIIVGNNDAADNVKQWFDQGIQGFTGTDSLWKSKILTTEYSDFDIGILKPCDIHNLAIHQANKDFLKKVNMILLIEPSRIISSCQIGLSLIVNECESKDKKIVYCACDRNCDGLVDSLSHLLKTSITSVTATIQGGANTSQMYWDADGPYMHHKILPNISRYLGIGTEINAVAMKYQISSVNWIGGEKFPVADMKWIAGQYYKQICSYADIPVSQESFNRAFNISADMWNSKITENSFFVVEDEFRNLFEMTRVFASRAKTQGFVNVISENYFLRDYMLDNVKIFSADPKAIPTIVPDFARTERNVILKLIMRMSSAPVKEEDIKNEFSLCGIYCDDDIYTTLKKLITRHCAVSDTTITVRYKEETVADSLNTDIFKYYEINETSGLYEYSQILKTAYYIAEDEETESHYIGAKLYGHVFQAMLPGQFVTLDGKYYEVRTITPQNGVVLRRAADHITNRRYYRQIQNITLNNWVDNAEMGAIKTISDIKLTYGYADITVATEGYIEMLSYGDLRNGRKVLVNGIPNRIYKNKCVLKIKMPEVPEGVLYTMCFILNEIFKTTYPNTYQYISAVVPHGNAAEDNSRFMLHGFGGDEVENCIYIIEDSEIDLGLTVSVERNIDRYFDIITDVLSWHLEKKHGIKVGGITGVNDTDGETEGETDPATGENDPEVNSDDPVNHSPAKKKGIWTRIKEFFKKIFGRKKKEKAEEESAEETESDPAEDIPEIEAVAEGEISDVQSGEGEQEAIDSEASEEIPEAADEEELSKDGKKVSSDDDLTQEIEKIIDEQDSDEDNGTDADNSEADGDSDQDPAIPMLDRSYSPIILMDEIDDNLDFDGEDEELSDPEEESAPVKYTGKSFLNLGFEEIPASLLIKETVEYLTKIGFSNGPLKQVRSGADIAQEIEETYDPQQFGAHFCDFCGIELVGSEYERLKDGRERCNRCSLTAVKKAEDFKDIFKNVLRNMEIFYGIKINVAIKVRTTDAHKIAKHVGQKFVPTPGFDGRVLGFAQKDKTGYSIYVENGSPKLATVATIAHELTHIWQYLNWNEKEIDKTYGKSQRLEIYEGMAKWIEIQYLLLLNEVSYAKRQEIMTRMRQDEYGRGFLRYLEQYPLSYDTSVKMTPFDTKLPLTPPPEKQ